MSNNSVVQTYESLQLNRVLDERLHPGGLELTVRMAEVAGLAGDSHILDVGCGRGTSLLFFSKQFGCTGVGIDLSPISIGFAAERAVVEGLSENVQFTTSDACELPFLNNAFDVVYSECTLSLVANKAKAFQEMARVLKPGGKIVVTDIVLNGVITDRLKQEIDFVCCFTEALPYDGYQDFAISAGLDHFAAEDHSPLLKRSAFEVSRGYGSLDEFWKQFGQGKMPCCSSGGEPTSTGGGWKLIFKEGRPGYWLLAWKKPET